MFKHVPGTYRRFLMSCVLKARVARAFRRYSAMTEAMNGMIACINKMVSRKVISYHDGIRLYRRIMPV